MTAESEKRDQPQLSPRWAGRLLFVVGIIAAIGAVILSSHGYTMFAWLATAVAVFGGLAPLGLPGGGEWDEQ